MRRWTSARLRLPAQRSSCSARSTVSTARARGHGSGQRLRGSVGLPPRPRLMKWSSWKSAGPPGKPYCFSWTSFRWFVYSVGGRIVAVQPTMQTVVASVACVTAGLSAPGVIAGSATKRVPCRPRSWSRSSATRTSAAPSRSVVASRRRARVTRATLVAWPGGAKRLAQSWYEGVPSGRAGSLYGRGCPWRTRRQGGREGAARLGLGRGPRARRPRGEGHLLRPCRRARAGARARERRPGDEPPGRAEAARAAPVRQGRPRRARRRLCRVRAVAPGRGLRDPGRREEEVGQAPRRDRARRDLRGADLLRAQARDRRRRGRRVPGSEDAQDGRDGPRLAGRDVARRHRRRGDRRRGALPVLGRVQQQVRGLLARDGPRRQALVRPARHRRTRRPRDRLRADRRLRDQGRARLQPEGRNRPRRGAREAGARELRAVAPRADRRRSRLLRAVLLRRRALPRRVGLSLARRDRLAHAWRHLPAEQLDRAQRQVVRERSKARLREEARVSEEGVLVEDLLHDLVHGTDHERAAQAAQLGVVLAREARPAALAPDPVH